MTDTGTPAADLDGGAAIATAVEGLDGRIIPLLLLRRAAAGRLYDYPSHRLKVERAASIRYTAELGITGPDLAATLHRQALRAWHGSDTGPPDAEPPDGQPPVAAGRA